MPMKSSTFDAIAIFIFFFVLGLTAVIFVFSGSDGSDYIERSNQKIAECRNQGGNPVVYDYYGQNLYKECILP